MEFINTAENWEKVYRAYEQINFNAFDYDSVKKSLIDYVKIYYPEDFNDYIESSELITLIEVFSYVSELFSYRLDLNAHENFVTTAQRKESILRIAKLLSYKASRNIPARGMVKIESISTTERVIDSRGTELSNTIIKWNDPDNSNWKEQFLLVMNRILEQEFGSVSPDDRVQVFGNLFEIYNFNNRPLNNGVVQYSATTNNNSYDMELVPADLDDFGPKEKRPQNNNKFSVVYSNDGLGDSSDNTGFFFFTKQGTLQKTTEDFDGITPNQTFDIEFENINETDVWVNNIDPDSGEVVGDYNFLTGQRGGFWEQVDLANAQNVLFNTNPNRNKYEVETLDNDRLRIIFGDGNFSAIPSGRFEFWTRQSANEDFFIPSGSIQNVSSSFDYLDETGSLQTVSFKFSLRSPLQNAAPSENIENIRKVAPSVYYTQDRMVNGRDYNEFPLQDNSILKLRATNRTFSGDSKYLPWYDPSEYYENVKIFGDDLVIYNETIELSDIVLSQNLPSEDGGLNIPLLNTLISNHIEPLLSTDELTSRFIFENVDPLNIRKTFTENEKENIIDELQTSISNRPKTIWLDYTVDDDQWVIKTTNDGSWWIYVTANSEGNWEIGYRYTRIVFHSDETDFWINNESEKVLNYDDFSSNFDKIIILKSNLGTDGILEKNYFYDVLRGINYTEGLNTGLNTIHDLEVVPSDEDNNTIPDEINLDYLISGNDYVYFNRQDSNSPWVYQPTTPEVISSYESDSSGNWKRENGIEGINFLWLHRTPRYHLVDPSSTNIIDMFVINRGYYLNVKRWLNGQFENPPVAPTSFELRRDYNYILENKMLSDTVILHSGKIKVIIGQKAKKELQAIIKVIKSENRILSDNQIKTRIVDAVSEFFDITNWEFGQTFYFTELSSFIHSKLPVDIESVVIVPRFRNKVFGDLFEIRAKADEIIQPHITVNDIDIVDALNPELINQKVD